MEGPRGYPRHARVRERPQARYTPRATPSALAGVLLDTDVLIEVLRGRRRVAKAILELEAAGTRTYACAVSWAEVHAGLRPGEEALTHAFLGQRAEVVIDVDTGRRAGEYLARYGKSHGLEIADALVAAAATTSGLTLWTLSRRDYPMPDLRFYAPP